MTTPPKPKPGSPLTAKEIAVMDLLIEGTRPKRIGDHVFLAQSSVNSYLYRIRAKLGAKTTVQAAVLYARSKTEPK